MQSQGGPAHASFDPDRVYRHTAYRLDGPPPSGTDGGYIVVAHPGEAPVMPPEAGDLLVRVALGEPWRGNVGRRLDDGNPAEDGRPGRNSLGAVTVASATAVTRDRRGGDGLSGHARS